MIMVISDWTDKSWHLQWLSDADWLFHIQKDIGIPGDLHSAKREDNGDGLPLSQMPYYMGWIFCVSCYH